MPQTITSRHTKDVPLAVWPVTQITSQYQHSGRYVSESYKHPGKMVPALARRIIETYSSPGDLVLDPMAGIGTTLVERASIGPRCAGIELEEQWVDVSRKNIDYALDPDERPLANALVGDARDIAEILGDLAGTIDLIATSPPYGCEVAAIDKPGWIAGSSLKSPEGLNYSKDRSNIGHARGRDYESEMLAVYSSCFEVLRADGILVTVTKNMRRRDNLVDLSGKTVRLATSAGFGYLQHNIALLCAVRDGGLVARPSFWQANRVRQARSRGIPQHLVTHGDVLAFVKPKISANSSFPTRFQEVAGV